MNNKVETPSHPQTNNTFQIRIATQQWEKREIYRLRYQVYVREMAKPLHSAINKDKQISDALDNKSILLYAQSGNDIIGTMRLTIAAAEDYPSNLAETFHLHTFKELSVGLPNSHLGLGTKLAVIAEYRNSPVLFFLLAEAYRIVRKQGIQFFFGGCNPSLIPLYERIGFRRFTQNFTDPGYGLLVPLVIILEDIQHLQSIKSPIYRYARKYSNNPAMTQRFLKAFPESTKHLNTQLITPERLWNHVEYQTSASPSVMPLFKHLTQKNIIDILAAGAIFSCTSDDCILYQDNLCNDLYILLSGGLLITSQAGSRTLQPGDHFGPFTISSHPRQAEWVSVLTESEVFVLPRQAFTRYQHLHPQAAEILLSNLKTTQDFAYACATLTEQGGIENE